MSVLGWGVGFNDITNVMTSHRSDIISALSHRTFQFEGKLYDKFAFKLQSFALKSECLHAMLTQ